jgi:hypothetical protein
MRWGSTCTFKMTEPASMPCSREATKSAGGADVERKNGLAGVCQAVVPIVDAKF